MTDERYTAGCCAGFECTFEDVGSTSFCRLTDRDLPADMAEKDEPPDWCPLRKGPVLVTLKLRS